MTKTIFGKKLLLIATITILVTGLTLAATFNDAEAKKPKGPKIGTFDIKCKSSGTFIGGAEADPLGTATVVSAIGKCNAGLGKISSVSVLVPNALTPFASDEDDFPAVKNCFGFESARADTGAKPSPSIIFNKKGDSILYEVKNGKQCFFDANGDPASPLTPTPFCKIVGPGDATDPLSIHFASSTADFVVISEPPISRFQSTGAFADATGSGTITAESSLCDRGFPLANWSISELKGTITVPAP